MNEHTEPWLCLNLILSKIKINNFIYIQTKWNTEIQITLKTSLGKTKQSKKETKNARVAKKKIKIHIQTSRYRCIYACIHIYILYMCLLQKKSQFTLWVNTFYSKTTRTIVYIQNQNTVVTSEDIIGLDKPVAAGPETLVPPPMERYLDVSPPARACPCIDGRPSPFPYR